MRYNKYPNYTYLRHPLRNTSQVDGLSKYLVRDSPMRKKPTEMSLRIQFFATYALKVMQNLIYYTDIMNEIKVGKKTF